MQELVNAFIKENNLECNAEIRYIDLVSEIGELGKEIIKGSNYGNKSYQNTDNLKEEIGDCLFSLLALCSKLNIDSEDALKVALQKYQGRLVERGTISSN